MTVKIFTAHRARNLVETVTFHLDVPDHMTRTAEDMERFARRYAEYNKDLVWTESDRRQQHSELTGVDFLGDAPVKEEPTNVLALAEPVEEKAPVRRTSFFRRGE